MWWHHDWSGWNWFFMMVTMVAFWALAIAAVVWIVHAVRESADALPQQRSARDALDERFARGEITEEEYRRARNTLSER